MGKETSIPRKKFLSWTLGIGSALALPAFLLRSKKNPPPPATAKMLTQDGRLVEVDVAHANGSRRKVSDGEVHSWIKNKPKL